MVLDRLLAACAGEDQQGEEDERAADHAYRVWSCQASHIIA